MSENATQEAAAQGAANSNGLMNVPVTTSTGTGKAGEFHTVWPKKDLQGTPSRMEKKEGDRVTNLGHEVVDPATGEPVYLIRVHRGKRVWYSKGVITEEARAEFAAAAAARAAATPAATPAAAPAAPAAADTTEAQEPALA